MQYNLINEPPIFDGTNYSEWKIKMECFIKATFGFDALILVIDGWSPPTLDDGKGRRINNPFKDWTSYEREICTLNSRALNAIFCSIGQQPFKRIAFCKTAKEAWEKLQTAYEKTRWLKTQALGDLERRFSRMKMEEDETISSYHERLMDITYEGGTLGRTFGDDELVQKVLWSLPKRFNLLVAAILAKGPKDLKLGDVIGSLKSNEKKLEGLTKFTSFINWEI